MLELLFYGATPRRYVDPLHILQTDRSDAVAATLRDADDALRAGYSIAGYLTYEAGTALEGVTAPPPRNGEPLLALGVYSGPSAIGAEPATPPWTIGPLVTDISWARYQSDLAAIAGALYEGDAYQVNYTVPFDFACEGDPLALFQTLRRRAAVPYAAYVGHGTRAYVSLSPELFIEIDGDRIRTRPMKGTSVDPEDLHDSKNRAEHVMIVDLLRNDLHKVCREVRVPALFDVERFPTFATMTSTIEGTLEPGYGLAECFAAMFPCGSVTGAPKRSAMREIGVCEAAPRGIAMGTIGYCEPDRRGVWNVAIRTLAIDTERACGTVRIGGGIVADSTAGGEWAEILLKRRVFDDRTRPVSLIETMLVRVDGTVQRLERHLDRLERSAFALGLQIDIDEAQHAIHQAAMASRDEEQLLRLEAAPNAITALLRAFEPAPRLPGVCLAPNRLHSGNPALRFKTNARAAYEAALRFARERGYFEALLLNECGRVGDGARTTLFVASEGTLLTPPLDDGALAGVLRAEMIETGAAHEAVIDATCLESAELYIGNSARGLQRVTLAGS